ncbi:MAG TPA: protocatechuate 3,4-dioxygenase subunit beta [Gaiella sp.]|nr:protocatechuate 3,4-dioxygenase subunit beta [Gaiella sp.]
MSGEIQHAAGDGTIHGGLGERVSDEGYAGGANPPYLYPGYVSTTLRAPKRPLVILPHTLSELSGPAFGEGSVGELDHDLTRQHEGEPIGQRIIVSGRLLDSDGRPIRNQLVEIWQANAAGRYVHKVDQHPAPLDPNFTGAGRCLTDDEGRYRFVTIRPGSYPWQNHDNAWRPAHIHFSVFGRAFTHRLVTQMYFPDDPLFDQDPIFQSVRDPGARERMISAFDIGLTVPSWAHGYSFDIVVGGPAATPLED